MFNKIMIFLVILAASLVIVWLYNINKLVQYEICSTQPVTELSQSCREVINGQI